MPTALRIVIGGSLLVTAGHRPAFAIETKDFAIGFSLGDTGSFNIPNAGGAGTQIDPSGVLAGDQTLSFGIVDYRGTVYPQLWFAGTLTFSATSFTIPGDSASVIHHTTPFTLAGDLRGYTNNPFLGNPGASVFDVRLKGKGKVTTRLTAANAGVRSVTSYFFAFR